VGKNSTGFKVVIENLDENVMRNRKDSLLAPLNTNMKMEMKIEHDDHNHQEIIKEPNVMSAQ
jgi:hypothetical protein